MHHLTNSLGDLSEQQQVVPTKHCNRLREVKFALFSEVILLCPLHFLNLFWD